MRKFNVKQKLARFTMSKQEKIEIYRHDAGAGEKVNKLYANKELWSVVKEHLDSFHDEAVKRISQRNLPDEELRWVNDRISLISEIYKKFDAKKKLGDLAQQKLKEMEDVR